MNKSILARISPNPKKPIYQQNIDSPFRNTKNKNSKSQWLASSNPL
jgi:hypothetical protein